MRTFLTPLLAGLVTAAVITTPFALAGHQPSRANAPATATAPEVVGYGKQSGQPGGPRTALFGVFATGSGNAATGSVSFIASPTRPKLITGMVTCMVISGNDAIITLNYKQAGVQHVAVAEAVDNSNPTADANPDAWRVSFDPFINPTPDPNCWTPVLSPVPISPSGGGADIRVEPGP